VQIGGLLLEHQVKKCVNFRHKSVVNATLTNAASLCKQ
jgi:hypothetical protein